MNSRKPFAQLLWESNFGVYPQSIRATKQIRNLSGFEDIAFLLQAFEDEDHFVRSRAKNTLRRMMYASSFESLQSYLEYPHPVVKQFALYALRQFDDTHKHQVGQLLLQYLADQDETVANTAELILAELPKPPINSLLELSRSKNQLIKGRARRLIEIFDRPNRSIKIWMNPPSPYRETHVSHLRKPFKGYLSPQEKVLRANKALWLEKLLSEDAEESRSALDKLRNFHSFSSKPLIEGISRASDESFQRLIFYLGSFGSLGRYFQSDGLDGLLGGDLKTKTRLAMILGYFTENESTPLLLELIKDPNSAVKIQALRSLSRSASSDIFESIQHLAESPDEYVRAETALTFGALKAQHSIESLNKLTQNSSKRVREAAVWALGKLDEPAKDGLLAVLLRGETDLQISALEALMNHSCPEQWSIVFDLLSDPRRHMRRKAADLLRVWSLPEVVEALIKVLKNPKHPGRMEAAYALGRSGSRLAIEPLCQILEDPNPLLRKTAVENLSTLRNQRALPALDKAKGDPDWRVSQSAERAFKKIKSLTPWQQQVY